MRNVNPILAELLEGIDWDAVPPRVNVAPGTDVLTIDQVMEGRQLVMRRWGLVPRWMTPQLSRRNAPMINARSETIAERPTFRASFRDRRCVLPADGYLEWREVGSVKQPYLVQLNEGEGLRLAGLWDRNDGPAGSQETCVIATTSPAPALLELHDRMPVLLTREGADLWLDPTTSPPVLQALLCPWSGEGLSYHAADRRVGNPRFQDPAMLSPVDDPFERAEPPQGQLDFG